MILGVLYLIVSNTIIECNLFHHLVLVGIDLIIITIWLKKK